MNQTELAILLSFLSYASNTTKSERLSHISSQKWEAVVALARKHGVVPLVYHRLKQLGAPLPSKLTKELKQAVFMNVERNIRLYRELEKILRRLWDQGITVIVLKGAYLAEAVYNNIGLRIIGDVDLLVRKVDLLSVEKELLALGYKPEECNRVIAQDNYHFSYTLPRNSLCVEIHWELVESSHPFQFGMENLWSRAQLVTVANARTWTLSPIDLLLHLCLHTAKHAHNMQLFMLCDIGEVVQRYEAVLDWQEIGVRAQQWGITHSVYVILRLAQELLDVAVPADWLASLQPESFDQCYLNLARSLILDTFEQGDIRQDLNIARLWGLKGLGSKLAVIFDRLLPSRERMALYNPVPANSWRIYLYYPVRIQYLLKRYGATLWKLIRADPVTRAAADHTNQVTVLLDWLMSK